MRIIAGEFRHRKLLTPKDGSVTRPIPDRVKESLFSILRGWTEGATVVDAFAGTGAIGLEAISRGAARCVFLERDRRIVELIRRNAEALGCEDRCEIVCADALGTALLSRCPRPVDLVFFDPPYPLVQEPAGWGRVKAQFTRVVSLLADQGYAVLRTPWPFRHRIEEEKVVGSHVPRRSTVEAIDAQADEDECDEDDEEVGDESVVASPTRAIPVDLRIPGAVGPETHVYGHTAIHLYMRERKAAPA